MIKFYRAANVPEEEKKQGIGRRRFLLQSGKGIALLGLGVVAGSLGGGTTAKASTEADFFSGTDSTVLPCDPPNPYWP